MLELAFEGDRGSGEPLYRQLEGYLRELIAAGRLRPGERLPATRDLARDLELARNTVSQAYQALLDDGLLRARVGRGTFVAGANGDDPQAPAAAAPLARGFAWGGLLARRTRGVVLSPALRDEARGGRPRFDFRGGQVDPTALSVADLKRAFARALDRHVGGLADPGDPRGFPPLREAIATKLLARGIRCGADDVLVTSGAQQGLDLLARVLVDPGDAVALEQPGYFGAALAFAASEAHLVPVGVDAEGLRTDELARILRARRVKLLFTTPAVQSPTGVSLSAARRRALLALSDEYQLPVVEDDYDSELRYGGPPVPALVNQDDAGRVVYLGTFSKALFPGLRVGYLVAPRPLLMRLVLSRWAGDFGSDVVTQAALAELLESGALERHVRRVRRLYAERREALLAALRARMPEGTRAIPPAGGTSVWVTLPERVDPAALFAAAREAGVAYTRGDAFTQDGSGARHLSLSFARLAREEIEAGVDLLSDLARRSST